MREISADPASDVGTGIASRSLASLDRARSALSGRIRAFIRWIAVLVAGAALSALLTLEHLERPGYEVVIFSVGAFQWRPTMHFIFLASMCIALGTIAHQLAWASLRLERAAAWVLGPLVTVCGVAIVILLYLFTVFASVRQYVTITADDGAQFLVRAITWHHTDYTVLEPAGGPWYSDGVSILTADPNHALATGEYVLQRTPTGYHLMFSRAPGEGARYQLDW